MKVMGVCRSCLEGLAKKAVELSSGTDQLLSDCFVIIKSLWGQDPSPPFVANQLLKYISKETGVSDPFAAMKETEYHSAKRILGGLTEVFPDTLEGALRLSVLGNSGDFFAEGSYNAETMQFGGDVDRIDKALYTAPEEVLIIGDNISDFLFDMPLARYLEKSGKKVYYATREYPVQNDMCMSDVKRFGLDDIFDNIVSTGTGEVGIRREDMTGKIKELWDGDNLVIAKGMGNYETMSEYRSERPVVHIMKIKCDAVSADTGIEKGTYVAIV